MADSSAKILVENTKWVYVAKIIGQLIGLAATILVIRKLAVDVFGTYNLLTQSFVVFQIISLGAIHQVFLRYIPELIANQEYKKFKHFISMGFGLMVVSFTFFISILYIFRDPFASFFNIPDFDKYILPLFLYSLFFAIKGLASVTLHSLLLHKKYAFISILNAVIRLSLYLIYYESLSVSLLLYIEIINSALFVLISGYIYWKHVSGIDFSQKPLGKSPVTSKRILRYGLFSTGNVLGQGIVGRTSDYFIVAALSNPFQVGLYAFAVRIYGLIYEVLPIKQFYSVLRPLFLKRYSQDHDVKEFQQTLAFMVKCLLPIYLFPFLYFLFFGKDLINIVFDSRYIDAYWVIIILLLTKPLGPFTNTIGFTLQLKERVDLEMYSKIVIVFSIAAGIIGMKTFGIYGVAIASTIGLYLQNIFIWYKMSKYPEISFRFSDYIQYLLIISLLTPFLFILYIDFNLLALIILSLFFFLYTCLLFVLFSPLTAFDLTVLEKIASGNTITKKTFNSLISFRSHKTISHISRLSSFYDKSKS